MAPTPTRPPLLLVLRRLSCTTNTGGALVWHGNESQGIAGAVRVVSQEAVL